MKCFLLQTPLDMELPILTGLQNISTRGCSDLTLIGGSVQLGSFLTSELRRFPLLSQELDNASFKSAAGTALGAQ